MTFFRVKRAFTLIELILVIILISLTYYLIFSSSTFFQQKENQKFSIVDSKEFLLENFEFKNEIALVCLNKDFTCYIKIDGTVDKDYKFENIFKNKPDIYSYTKEQNQVEFPPVIIDDIEYDVFLEIRINSDFKSNELIIDTLNDKVYIFNAVFKKAFEYSSLGDAYEVFNINESEVKDAF